MFPHNVVLTVHAFVVQFEWICFYLFGWCCLLCFCFFVFSHIFLLFPGAVCSSEGSSVMRDGFVRCQYLGGHEGVSSEASVPIAHAALRCLRLWAWPWPTFAP